MTQGEGVPGGELRIATYGDEGTNANDSWSRRLLAIAAIVAAIPDRRIPGQGVRRKRHTAAYPGTVTLTRWQTSPGRETKLSKVVRLRGVSPEHQGTLHLDHGDYHAAMLAKFRSAKPSTFSMSTRADFCRLVRQRSGCEPRLYVKAVEVSRRNRSTRTAEMYRSVPWPFLRVPEGLVLAGKGGQHSRFAGNDPIPSWVAAEKRRVESRPRRQADLSGATGQC